MTITINPLTEYTQHLQSENKSTNTIKSYCKDIESFFKYFNLSLSNIDTNTINNTNNTTPPMITITREQILQYREYLKNKSNNARTINRCSSALKSYNEFLIKNKYQESMVVLSVDYIKVQKQLISPTNTTIKEAIRFMNKIKVNECPRNYYIVSLLLNTGLRISEALNIKLNDIMLGNKKKLRVIGKGNKQRIIPLNDVAVEIIKDIIEDRKNYKYAIEVLQSEYLFVSKKGEKLRSDSIERIFNKYSNVITPHSLRHCFATNFLESGGNIKVLQMVLGHSELSTTSIYLNPSESSFIKSMNDCCIK